MDTADQSPVYRDSSLPTSERVADLLDRMTTREKAGQLVGTWAGDFDWDHDLDDVREQVTEDLVGTAATFGWNGCVDLGLEEIVEHVNELQEFATSETRLGIPLLFSVDAVHGHAYVAEATTFPNGLGAAATWDPDLVERSAEITAAEVRATGAQHNYAPVCDMGRAARSGRVFETFGESPQLVGDMTAAQVRGYQGDGLADPAAVAATAKHFPAYGEPERGEDSSPNEISEYKLRNVHLRPFERVVEEDVESVMPNYSDINGEPAHGSRYLLSGLLRGDLGFDGHVVSDWGGVHHLHAEHRTASDQTDSVRQAFEAGLDLSSTGRDDHVDILVDLVESGDLSERDLEESVARILRWKFELGLFEDPYVDLESAREVVGRDEHRQFALETARESVTLLQNEDDLLPLSESADVFVGGPNAADLVHQMGGWSINDDENYDVDGATVLDGVRETFEGEVSYERGATINDLEEVDAAAEKAAEADVAVLVLGEPWYIHEFGPSAAVGSEKGEFPTRSRLSLPDAQRDLVAAVAETGTPVVGVLVTGRPLAVSRLAEAVPALLMAYYPGKQGGRAVAETLAGENEPSGRLPISMPRSVGDLPQHFNHFRHPRPLGPEEHPPSYDPLFEFGHGLSYTEFEYDGISASPETVGPAGTVEVSVDVENAGDRRGTEVVQVYASDVVSTRISPVRELVGYDRVTLDAGERREVSVALPVEDLGTVAPDGDDRTEPGRFDLSVGELETSIEVESEYR